MRGKIIPILLLVGFIVSSLANHVLFQLERMRTFIHFSEVKNSDWPGQIQTFIYSGQPGFHWEKRNKEFSFNGKLFDVISTKDTSLGLRIKCIADQEEDNIVDSYLKLIDTAKNKKGWISFLKLKFNDSTPVGISEQNHETLYNNLVILLKPPSPSSPYLEIFSPPPKQYCTHFVG